MHIFTHLKAESEGKTGLGIYADGMVEHDGQVGQVLAKLKELGLDDNTIVMYSTTTARRLSRGRMAARRCSAARRTQWEGGYRVRRSSSGRASIKPGTVINDIGAHEDMLTTFSRRRRQDVKEDLLKGRKVGGMNYKVHLDGYDLGPALRGEAAWPRREFIYWTDDAASLRLRYDAGRSRS